jgi:hypothetical protein
MRSASAASLIFFSFFVSALPVTTTSSKSYGVRNAPDARKGASHRSTKRPVDRLCDKQALPNGRVVAIVFAGRKNLMRMLMRNLVRELYAHTITHVHLWDFIADRQSPDAIYLRELAARYPCVTVKQGNYKEIPCASCKKEERKTARNWAEAYSAYVNESQLADNDVLIKLDDDLPYIRNLPALIKAARLANGFVYPNILNNDVGAHWQMHDGMITPSALELDVPSIHMVWERRHNKDFYESERPLVGAAPCDQDKCSGYRPYTEYDANNLGWYQEYKAAMMVHQAFIANPYRFYSNVTHVWNHSQRVSINFVAGRGAVVREVYRELSAAKHFPLDDEPLMSFHWPRMFHFTHSMVMSCLVVHLHFGPQKGDFKGVLEDLSRMLDAEGAPAVPDCDKCVAPVAARDGNLLFGWLRRHHRDAKGVR